VAAATSSTAVEAATSNMAAEADAITDQ
jgi:hypothetical protein